MASEEQSEDLKPDLPDMKTHDPSITRDASPESGSEGRSSVHLAELLTRLHLEPK